MPVMYTCYSKPADVDQTYSGCDVNGFAQRIAGGKVQNVYKQVVEENNPGLVWTYLYPLLPS